MSLISRLTTWAAGQVLKAADLNNEFSNITNLFNNLDAATTAWTNVKGGTLNSTTAYQFNGASIVKVMQILQTNTVASQSLTSSTFTAISAMSQAITPVSASSKILILVSGNFKTAAPTATTMILTLKRGSTDLGGGSNTGFSQFDTQTATGQFDVPYSFHYLDSPATTSATTYQVFMRSSDNASAVTHNAVAAQCSITTIELL